MIANTLASVARRWRWIAAGVAVLAAMSALWCGHGGLTPLPGPVAQQVERHSIATAVDTADIHRLERVAAGAQAKQDAESANVLSTKSLAKRAGANADSAARAAARADSVRDSVVAAVGDSADGRQLAHPPPVISDSIATWRNAYEMRSAEVVALNVVIAQQDTALAFADLRATSIDSALARSEARAARADSALAAVIKVAESRTAPCRIARLLPCPSRTAVMIGAAVVTAALLKWPTIPR